VETRFRKPGKGSVKNAIDGLAEEHSKALREFLQSGMSYSRIADAINAKFKTAYSATPPSAAPSEWDFPVPTDPGTGRNRH
jgi:hypothetical protein